MYTILSANGDVPYNLLITNGREVFVVKGGNKERAFKKYNDEYLYATHTALGIVCVTKTSVILYSHETMEHVWEVDVRPEMVTGETITVYTDGSTIYTTQSVSGTYRVYTVDTAATRAFTLSEHPLKNGGSVFMHAGSVYQIYMQQMDVMLYMSDGRTTVHSILECDEAVRDRLGTLQLHTYTDHCFYMTSFTYPTVYHLELDTAAVRLRVVQNIERVSSYRAGSGAVVLDVNGIKVLYLVGKETTEVSSKKRLLNYMPSIDISGNSVLTRVYDGYMIAPADGVGDTYYFNAIADTTGCTTSTHGLDYVTSTVNGRRGLLVYTALSDTHWKLLTKQGAVEAWIPEAGTMVKNGYQVRIGQDGAVFVYHKVFAAQVIWGSCDFESYAHIDSLTPPSTLVGKLVSVNGAFVLFTHRDGKVFVARHPYNHAGVDRNSLTDDEYRSKVQDAQTFCWQHMRRPGGDLAFYDPRCMCLGGQAVDDALSTQISRDMPSVSNDDLRNLITATKCGYSHELDELESTLAMHITRERCSAPITVCGQAMQFMAGDGVDRIDIANVCGIKQSCSDPSKPCKKGYTCVQGECIRMCTADSDCPNEQVICSAKGLCTPPRSVSVGSWTPVATAAIVASVVVAVCVCVVAVYRSRSKKASQDLA